MSLFYLLIFLITKIILWFQKPKKKTVRIFPESSRPWNIFYPVTLIGRQIFLGSCVQASDIIFLEKSGVSHIVNVSMEIPNFYSQQFKYYNLRIQDNGLESFKSSNFEQVFSFINEALKNTGNKKEFVSQDNDLGNPEGVAKIVAFIISDDADYLRGSIITR